MAMDRQTIIDLLFSFGEQEAGQPWLDYAGCGFTAADAPLLAALVADENLSNADADSNEVWIPLHAWRALQPLMPAGLQELLPALQVLDEDDWANAELPQVFAAAGAVAIAPLQAFIQDDAHTEFARGTAVDALTEIARRDAGLRVQVLTALVERLQASAEDDGWVNGCIVSALIDMEAVEAFDAIRDAYAADKVDWSFCGDLEDVQMELGLREERDTPRPRYNVLGDGNRFPPPSIEPVGKDIGAEELAERIEQFLNFYGSQEAIGSLTELHGFFSAIGCSPEPVRPAEWLPEIWGGEDLAPDWPDQQTIQVFFDLIMPVHNAVMGQLQAINQFEIPFDVYGFGGLAFTDYSRWCSGFEMGAQVGRFPTMDIPGVGVFLDDIFDGSASAENKSFEHFRTSLGMSPAEKKARERTLNKAVRAIYILGRGGQVTAAPVMHAAVKVGRNDPCPCGSGKKYKKCCLH
jgi:yecA family protein